MSHASGATAAGVPELSRRCLWITLLAPPLLWFADQQLSYAITPWSCRHATKNLLYVISATTLSGVGLSALLGTHFRSRIVPRGDADHLLADLSTLSAAIFAIVIVAQAIPRAILSPCE